jgi:predicted DNA-binding WGR domain protein
MIPDGDFFNVQYGRVGVEGFQTDRYDISTWDKKLKEKLRKGYQNQTRLF